MGSRILIVDDHEVVRQGIRTILRARPQWEVVGEAVNGRDAIEKAQSLDPDVIIMDITMPEMSGIEATREISKLKLRSAVLVFTMHESKNLASTVQEAGARGFVLKSHAARDLLEALEALMRAFVECRIKPYYLHHGDLAPGTAHLRTTLERGQELMRALRGRVSGLCQPDYMLDIPGGHGKAPVGPNYLSPANSASPTNSFSREREQAVETRYRVVDYCGEVHLYPPIAMIDP